VLQDHTVDCLQHRVQRSLLGAWLRFNATAGLPALITAIVGAIAGAHLLLLALDISQRHQVHAPPVETTPVERVEVASSAG
jgi:hypothetical protein